MRYRRPASARCCTAGDREGFRALLDDPRPSIGGVPSSLEVPGVFDGKALSRNPKSCARLAELSDPVARGAILRL
jgi:hypothetical protein